MISKTDLVSAYARRLRAGGTLLDSFDGERVEQPLVTARDIMSNVLLALRESESLQRAAQLFAAKGVHRAPVVDADGRVVGVLTSFDIVRALASARP